MVLKFPTASQLLDFLLNDDRFVITTDLWTVQRGRGKRGYVFRGQCHSMWPLLPAAHRAGSPLGGFTPQAVTNDPDWATSIENLQAVKRHAVIRLGYHIHAELRAVHHFLEQADRLGIATPIDYAALSRHQSIVDALSQAVSDPDSDGLVAKAQQASNEPFPQLEIVPSIALAQHHGVPTRLLDWTESPLVAAYFAAAGCVANLRPDSKPPNHAEVAIYILATADFHRADSGVRLALAPRHMNGHLRAQRGIFAYVPGANAFFLENHRWPSLEEALATTAELEGDLDLATLPSKEAEELLRLLWRYEITRHNLMPTLDHAARVYEYARAIPNWKDPSHAE